MSSLCATTSNDNSTETARPQLNTSEHEALLRWHALDQKELSVGIEIECFVPNLGAISSDRLVPVERQEDIFALVADSLSEQLSKVNGGGALRARKRRVSVDDCDWGRVWTAKGDESIVPRGENPFPVELVSQVMHFQDFDVSLFCDVMHALRSPPLRAATNDSTGLHVHFGRAPGFFSVKEVAAIMKAYLRFEPTINRLLLPINRQKNRFCRDLREMLAEGAGYGQTATDADLFSLIDSVLDYIRDLTPEERACLLSDCRVNCSKATADDCLEQTQLDEGEGYMYRTQRAIELETTGRQQHVPAGMVLHEMFHNGCSVWQVQGGHDAQTPWDALSSLDDEAVIECRFRVPEGVTSESLDFWIFRDSLILEKYGARYCKLNIMRIAKPCGAATIEFRQFPGSSFNQPLIIWGWVKFLALLVSHARATADEASSAELPIKGTKEHLKRFLHMSRDTMLLAWFQDLQNRLEQPEEALDSMRLDWQWLWTHWSSVRARTDARGFLAACKVWRRIHQAIKGMRPIFDDADCVWELIQEHQQQSEDFMQRLYSTLEQKLSAYVEQLRAAEECSRVSSLPTVVRLVIDGGRLQSAYNEVRKLQATIVETESWEACPEDLACSICDLLDVAASLMLDHARNLLALCERGVAGITGALTLLVEDETQRTSVLNSLENELQPDGTPRLKSMTEVGGVLIPSGGAELVAEKATSRDELRKEEVIGSLEGAHLPAVVRLRVCETDASVVVWVRRVYHELCSWIVVPRAGTSKALWKGLLARGWTPARVQALNAHMRMAKRSEAMALAAKWFAARRRVPHDATISGSESAAFVQSEPSAPAQALSAKERIEAAPML